MGEPRIIRVDQPATGQFRQTIAVEGDVFERCEKVADALKEALEQARANPSLTMRLDSNVVIALAINMGDLAAEVKALKDVLTPRMETDEDSDAS